jgi:hypothetical protein
LLGSAFREKTWRVAQQKILNYHEAEDGHQSIPFLVEIAKRPPMCVACGSRGQGDLVSLSRSSADGAHLAFFGDSNYVPHEAAPFVGVGWWLSSPRSPHSTTKAAASSIFN